jgi:adenylate cyclase class 2
VQFEVEQKFRIADPPALAARLAALGVTLSPPVLQVDTYFRHPARDFAQTDEAFRVRQIGDDNFVTYKGPRIDKLTKTRRELELPLPTGAATAEQYQQLFDALGFTVGGLVRKTRRSGAMLSQGHEVEIAWDEVEGLGAYLELELLAGDARLDDARAAILALAAQLGLNESERRSYLELVLGRR